MRSMQRKGAKSRFILKARVVQSPILFDWFVDGWVSKEAGKLVAA